MKTLASPWIGPLCAVFGVLGFSGKAIFIKLAYAGSAVDPVTLLALRMLYSAPFFIAMAWWSGRRADAKPIARADRRALVALGFIGYYLSSLLDFLGLQFITAALERLVLYLNPTLVLLLSALLFRQTITRRALCALALAYAGIALCLGQTLVGGGDARATALGAALVFASAVFYALYLVYAGPVIGRLGSSRFIAWAMLVRIPAMLTDESDDVDRVVSCGAWSSEFSAVGHHRCQFSGLESGCTTAGQPGRPASA